MLSQLVGSDGELWGCSLPMALVLLSTVPSGDRRIVELRDRIESSMLCPLKPKVGFLNPPVVRHVTGQFHQFSAPRVYIGFGHSDCQSRPSPWANPFYFFENVSPEQSLSLFYTYLESRADLPEFLLPLRGGELICDCNRGELCHGNALVDAFGHVFCEDDDDEAFEEKLDAMSVACVLERVRRR